MATKKKIALVAVWNHNYGSLLQTYALQTFLKKNNLDNEILFYKEKSIYRRLIRFINKDYFISKFKTIYKKILLGLFYRQINAEIAVRDAKFDNFKKKHLVFSNIINGRSSLKKTILHYDMAILGSDQVLHPSNLLMDYFTLNFVPDEIKRIAYSPSQHRSTRIKAQ